jgi:methyl-accepting chemotaxis protein
MFERLRIGTRLWAALALLALLVIAAAFSGRLALSHVQDTTQEILLSDAFMAEEALEVRAAALQLRRFEKDYFLNIGATDKQTEYLVKWHDARAELVRHLEELKRLVTSASDKQILAQMLVDLAAYEIGFEKVRTAMKAGEIATPQAANLALTPYKDHIRGLDKTAGALGGASDLRRKERVKLLAADASRANTQMAITAALAAAVALLMGVHLTRAITHPIRTAVSTAGRIAAGDVASPVSVTSNDEFGDLQRALKVIAERLLTAGERTSMRT